MALSLQDKVLMGLPQAVLYLDSNDQIIAAFGQVESLFLKGQSQFINSPVASLPILSSEITALCARVREEQGIFSAYNLAADIPLGDIELVDIHAAPANDDVGYIIVSIQPRRINSFVDSHADMEAASRSLSGLASMLAHEIKNPLSGIRGAAQLFERKLPKEDHRLTSMVVKEVDRISKLVGQLEAFSDIANEGLNEVNIHEVLDHVLEVAVSGFASEAEVIADFDPSLPTVKGNFDQLVQVFLNLIKNAVEAAGTNCKLEIETRYRHGVWMTGEDGKRRKLPVQVSIRDNGPGLPQNLKGHLFDPFVSGKEAGTGLGLAVVARYVSNMGGAISCETNQEGGASFYTQFSLFEGTN